MNIECPTAFFDYLDERCIEDGDCLVWSGPVASDGKPIACMCGKTTRLRGLVWRAAHCAVLPSNRRISDTCNNPRCLAPSHLKALTSREYMALASERGCLVLPLRSARNRATWQAKAPKLNRQKADEIYSRALARKDTGETLHSIAADFGVHFSLVDRIGKGLAWAPVAGVRGSSVFNLGVPA